jgi:predicted GTPase
VSFTATQIPYIDDKRYPASLAGKLYPKGIPIVPEEKAVEIIKKEHVKYAVFAYSDVSHSYVMNKASDMMAAGASYVLYGPEHTMLKSTKPLISVCAVRTGCGKSQTTRKILDILKKSGKKVVAIRHPMPYGDLEKQKVQRFATYEDMKKHECTIEEREEYEPYTSRGFVIYAGVDYEAILREAEKEADIILWDGGNNDFSFYKSDLEIVVLDPLRAGDELNYYPGAVNFRRANVLVVNKMDSATPEQIAVLKEDIKKYNPKAKVIWADSKLTADTIEELKGRKVLAIEDGPTTTHGGVKTGAASVFATRAGAVLVDPRAYAVGELKKTFAKYPNVGTLLPAMGYSDTQIKDLQDTVNKVPCDVVVSGTPIDIAKLIRINKPLVSVKYDLEEREGLKLQDVLKDFL